MEWLIAVPVVADHIYNYSLELVGIADTTITTETLHSYQPLRISTLTVSYNAHSTCKSVGRSNSRELQMCV